MKAANALFISPATMSRNIKNLESDLGVILFHRNSKYVELTEAGRIMLEGFRRLEKEYREIRVDAKNASQTDTDTIKIGIAQEFMPDFLPYAVNSFRYSNDGVNISYFTSTIYDLRQQFQNGQLDIIVGNSQDFAAEGTSCLFLPGKRLGLGISKMHPLASVDRRLSLKDFEYDTFVTLPDELAPAYSNLLSRCAKFGFTPRHMYARDLANLMLLIETNQCVSIIHENTLVRSSENIRFLEVDGIDPVKPAVFWRERNVKDIALQFITHLRTYIGQVPESAGTEDGNPSETAENPAGRA